MSGRLFIVSTPIGNLSDLSERALETLKAVDRIACEDTRRTGLLLSQLGFKTPMIPLHEHNERKRTPDLVNSLLEGSDLALVSDAGTPLLSDPGFVLVRAALEAGVEVIPVPGPVAFMTALVASGLPPYPFTFAGFAPPKTGKRKKFYEKLKSYDHTVAVFESPHRLLASLQDAIEVLGPDCPAVLARELTKIHEEFVRGTLTDLLESFEARPAIKGEFVLLLGSAH